MKTEDNPEETRVEAMGQKHYKTKEVNWTEEKKARKVLAEKKRKKGSSKEVCPFHVKTQWRVVWRS